MARYCESLRVLQLYRATAWGKVAREVLKNSYPHIQVHIYDIEVNAVELTEQRNALKKVISGHWSKDLASVRK